jgi:hypothetical protein
MRIPRRRWSVGVARENLVIPDRTAAATRRRLEATIKAAPDRMMPGGIGTPCWTFRGGQRLARRWSRRYGQTYEVFGPAGKELDDA